MSKAADKHGQLGDGPIEQKHHQQMNAIADTLDELFNGDALGNDRNTGFILMVFPFGNTDGRANYISNANRDDVVIMLKEQLARFEGQPEMTGRA
jgi:hypothetical protein